VANGANLQRVRAKPATETPTSFIKSRREMLMMHLRRAVYYQDESGIDNVPMIMVIPIIYFIASIEKE
jgi:hypothetical protein